MTSLEKNVIKDSFGWDVANWSRSIPFWEKYIGDIKGKNALELGNGGKFGGLSLWLAYKGANVVCSDYKGVSDEAKAIHAKYGFGKNIKYERIDATEIPYDKYFDLIACKSMLGGIVRATDIKIAKNVVNSINHALIENGSFIFCENGFATVLHQWLRERYGAGRKHWKYFNIDELKHISEIFNIVHIKSFGMFGCFGRNEKQKRLLSLLDYFIDPLFPINNRYIISGVLKKREVVPTLVKLFI